MARYMAIEGAHRIAFFAGRAAMFDDLEEIGGLAERERESGRGTG